MGVFVATDESTPWSQLIFLGVVYMWIVLQGCNLISDGSELLMLTRFAPLVGPVILPVLGAIPDGAIVIFSGLGSDAQEELDAGMGALAGSTVMLLTIPWFLCVLGGRVNLSPAGNGAYRKKVKLRRPDESHSAMLFKTGISLSPEGHGVVWQAAVMTAVTALPFLVVQGAAFADSSQNIADEDDGTQQSSVKKEKPFVMAGFVLSTFFFLAYLALSYVQAMSEDDDSPSKAIKGKLLIPNP